MEPNNTGSFGAAAGGISPELQAAIQRRVGQGGVTDQVTQSSPNAQPMPSTPPSSIPASSTPQIPTGGATGGQTGTERDDDAALILKAMSERLKSQNKIAENMAGLR